MEKKLFDFRLIGVGLLFLIDFNINTLDFLPDFIGLALIYAGIGKTFCVNENFAKAKKYIHYFLVFSALKFIWNVFYLISGTSAFESLIVSDNLALLLATAFTISELCFSIAVFTNIVKGLEIFFQIGDKITYEKKSGAVILVLEAFFVLKFVLTAIIYIPELLTEINLDNLSVIFDMYLDGGIIKSMMLPPCFIIQTLAGIFTLSIAAPFFFDAAKDDELREFIKAKINAALTGDNLFVVKQNLNSAFLFFMVGCVFFVDFKLDNINILPDFAICLFFLAGISPVLKIEPEIKNAKLNLYLAVNIFVSLFAYITSLMYRLTYMGSLTGENATLLRALKLSSDISHHASVIIFFLIFLEFYRFIRAFQHKRLEFAARHLNKRFMSSEQNLDKNKTKIITAAACAFCAKTLSVLLPQIAIVLFYHSLALVIFAVFLIRGLYLIREAVYSYYNLEKSYF